MLHFHSNLLLIASESRLIYNFIMTIEAHRIHSLIEQQAREGRPHWFQMHISNNPKEARTAYQQLKLSIGESVLTFVNAASSDEAILNVRSTSGQSEILSMVKGQEERFGDIVISLQEIRADSSAFMIFSPDPIKFPAVQSK